MQHLYTRHSETHSSIRNVFARLRQSVLANSLRTVILLFVLALSCNVWGEVLSFDITVGAQTGEKITQNEITVSSSNSIANQSKKIYYFKVNSNPLNITSTAANISKIQFTAAYNSQSGSAESACKITTSSDGKTYDVFQSGITLVGYGSQTWTNITVEFTNPVQYVRIEKDKKETYVNSLQVYTAPSTQTVYLRPNANWLQDNARFAVYYWDDASNTGWADMTRVSECEEVYMAQIPANYTHIIFCRMKPTPTENNWANTWNQTADCEVKNTQLYTIAEGAWDKGNGSWSTYTPATFSVSFDANGDKVEGTMSSIADIACGGTATLTENTFTRTNYTFAGWNTQADGNGTAYADKASITNIKTDITLYAQWTGVDYWYVSGNFPNHDFDLEYRFTNNQVAITLAANTTYEFKIQHQEGNDYIWFGNSGTMTSDNCAGWNFGSLGQDNINAKITTTIAGAYLFTMSVNPNGTPKLTVTYPALHTMKYDANMPMAWGKVVPFYAANIPTETASVGYGASYTISANTPAINVDENTDYAIYTFAGWNTQADGKGTTYSAGGTIPSVSGDITLYAQWTPRPFNITYYDDDQTTVFNLTPNTYTYPVSTIFPTPTKQGYSFLGWKTSPTATDYIAKTDTYHGDFTLYAEWKKETILYTDTYIWKKQADATGCVVNPNVAANANQEEVCTEKTYSSSTIGGGNSMGRPDNVGEYSITIAAQPGYLIQSICTYGKVETASQISWDKGITWTDLATYTEQKKVFTAPTGGAESFIIKCTTTKSDSGGIWWRNALVTLIDGPACTAPTFAWVNEPTNSRVQDEDFELSTTSNSGGAVIYQSNNTNVATIVDGNKLHFVGEGTVTITAVLAANGDYCDATLSTTIDVVDQCGTSSVIYNLPAGTEAKTLTTAESVTATEGLTANNAITAAGITLGTSGKELTEGDGNKENLTVSIPNTFQLDKTKYLSFEYTIADGKCFMPCDIQLKVQPISNACYFLIEMTDGNNTLSETTTSLEHSVVNDIRVNNPDNISFCGKVTLKIYSYGATKGYRLGTPIRILGTLDNSVTATIVPDGGTIPNAAALGWILQSDGTYTKQIPQGANLTMPDITRDGYTLTAYHDRNSDTYHPGNTFPLNANYTFTAQWRAVAPDGSVTAIVNPNGGVLTDETGWTKQLDGTFIQTVKKGSTLTLPEVTKTDYRFLYYTDETNDDYYPTSPFPLNADYVFTAQWCQHDTKLEWNVESWKFGDGTAPTLTTMNLPDGALIQYVSSNTAVATISDDGSTITPFMGGQTTITAIYDGDGDYCPAEASYTLTVECNDPTPQIVGEGILTGCNTSITLRVKQAQETGLTDYPTTGYSFQWYKDGQPIANATADTYTAQTVGEYFVVVHRDCYSQSNTAKITSNAAATPEVVTLTRFQYYRPGHTYTDNADTRHLFAYKSAGEDSKACEIKTVIKHAAKTAEKPDAEITDMSFLQTTGTPDENGHYTVTASLNAISADIDNLLTAGDTIVVTLTPYDNCGTLATAYAQSLNIYITNKPALAFIISGADSYTRDNKKHKLHGDFLTGINKADLCKQSGSKWAESDKGTELPLYRELKTDFEVVPVNGYAAFNLLNYEPFDIVMLTDFPKTDAIDKKTHPAYGVLDSLAYIVDYRPMFSLKGHMAKKELTTWGTKGFIADPETPTTNPQMNMTVLCYAHGIFDGLEDLKYTGESTPTKNDSLNKIILDKDGNIVVRITDGGGYNKEKALQGFTAVDANNFVNIAIIPEGKSGGSLITCCERQTNINARFLLLSVNADATSKITPIGQKAIIQGLHYLLETNAAKVSDCSVTFHNGGDTQNPGNGDHLWTTSTNWSTGRLPLKEQNIRIIANCIVNTTDASVANILIKDGNTLTINSNAALKTTGKIKQLNTDNTTSPLTNTGVITIKADAEHTGALIHTTTEDETLAATVQLYSKAYLVVTADGKKEKYWQYIGIPIKEAPIPENFLGAYTYLYSEQKSGRGWTRQFDGSSLHGDFSGYATSQTQAETFVLKGDLAATTDRRIRLTYTADGGQGSNLIGNSWTAPIRIDQLQTSDFNGADATIYIYNTGRDDVKDNPSYIEGSTTAGQWMSIPINMVNTAEWKGLKVIPAMQAFQVNTGEETDLVLNYNRLVRSSTTADINTPLRAPKRTDDALSVMRVRVSDSRTYTDLYLAQHPFFTDNFDNGWDAAFVEGDGRSASLYAITPLGEMAVAAQPQTDGTVLGFTPGRETEYTFSFGYTGEMLYLNDTKQKRSTLITDWNTYTFTANEDDDVNRFYISSTPIDVQTPTGLTNITTMDGILRINNPAHENLSIGIYDAAGRLCALSHTAEAMADIILPATQGVYLVHINGENTQIVHKVTR